MTASHRWTFSLSCPTCGATGDVGVVEESGPPFIDEPRRAFAVRGHFALKQGGADSATCFTCKATFPTGH